MYLGKSKMFHFQAFNLHFIHGSVWRALWVLKNRYRGRAERKQFVNLFPLRFSPNKVQHWLWEDFRVVASVWGSRFRQIFDLGRSRMEPWTGCVRFNALSVLKMWARRKKVKSLTWKPWLRGWVSHVLCSSVLRFRIILELDWGEI